jgi:hypothetical protein
VLHKVHAHSAPGPRDVPALPVRRDTPPVPVPRRPPADRGPSVDDQLVRLEQRLLAEAGGDPDVERRVRGQLVLARARFDGATIRRFLPILIEREVRRRLSAPSA